MLKYSTNLLWTSLFFVIGIYFLCFAMPLPTVDSLTYALISRDMSKSHDFLKLYFLHEPYLDKPPLLFWVSSVSFHLFGVSEWSFRLPAFIMILWSAWIIWMLAARFYGQQVAQYAVIFFLSSLAALLMLVDVKTDLPLTASICTAVYLMTKWLETYKTRWAIYAAGFIGFAMLAKGPLGLFAFGATILPSIFVMHRTELLKRRRQCLKTLAFMIFTVAIVLTPMMLGLYEQYGISGLKFFFWDQCFGRIVGSNPWKNHPFPGFLFVTLAWTFFPWSPFFYVGLTKDIVSLLKTRRLQSRPEYFSFFGTVLVLFALSFSSYQIDHYTMIAIPFASVYAGQAFAALKDRYASTLAKLVIIITGLLIGAVALWAFPISSSKIFLIGILCFGLAWCCAKVAVGTMDKRTSAMTLVVSACSLYLLLVTDTTKQILVYQGEHQICQEMQASKPNFQSLLRYGTTELRYDFCATAASNPLWRFDEISAALGKVDSALVLTEQEGFDKLKEAKVPVTIVKEFDTYNIEKMSAKFWNPATRREVLTRHYLLSYVKPSLLNHNSEVH
jgi:4-amino-4-deoxy-L-arabinose transferase-like glycosyltransferase